MARNHNLFKEFQKERKEHPTLPVASIWRIVYDHKKRHK